MDTVEQSAKPRAAGRTDITRETRITGEVAEQLWELYRINFEPLADKAMQQHLWPREEILEELADERIIKFVAWSNGKPVGLAMVTNHLELVPMISPRFLRRRYPEMAERNAIYYGILVFVDEAHRKKTAFAKLVGLMGQEAALASGVVVLDICEYNCREHNVDEAISRISAMFPGSTWETIDRHSWFASVHPNPLPEKSMLLR